MIVREREDEYVLISQHDHGKISGDIARHLCSKHYFHRHVEDVVFAAYEHDRCWIEADQTCRWNPETKAPYTFMDYPIAEKLLLYKQGLDEIERQNEYAALLSSLHFTTLVRLDPQPPHSDLFIQQETGRQNRLMKRLPHIHSAEMERHLAILQFCDRLSLFVCLNEPGVPKEKMHEWYRNGIQFLDRTLEIQWFNRREIVMEAFPFRHPFESEVVYTTVAKRTFESGQTELDLTRAQWTKQTVCFRPMHGS